MKQLNSEDYYRSRIEAEKRAAVEANCPQARRAHEEMATAYERMLPGKAERAA